MSLTPYYEDGEIVLYQGRACHRRRPGGAVEARDHARAAT